MPEVSYIGLGPILAKARIGLERGVTQAAEDLVAREQAAAPVDTGTLRGSIHIESIESGGDSVTATTATGGEASAYAIFVHEGTGAHIIEAKDGGFLDWPGAGHPVKVVHHPGTRANKYMTNPLLEGIPVYEAVIAGAVASEF